MPPRPLSVDAGGMLGVLRRASTVTTHARLVADAIRRADHAIQRAAPRHDPIIPPGYLPTPGDAERLRGIPVAGYGGAIPGTNPLREVLRRDEQSRRARAARAATSGASGRLRPSPEPDGHH